MDEEETEVHEPQSPIFEETETREAIGAGLGVEIGEHHQDYRLQSQQQQQQYDQTLFLQESQQQQPDMVYQDPSIIPNPNSNEYQLIYQETSVQAPQQVSTPTEPEKMDASVASGSASQSGTGTGSASPSRSWSSSSSRSEERSAGSRSAESREDQEEEDDVEGEAGGGRGQNSGSDNDSNEAGKSSSKVNEIKPSSSSSSTKLNNGPELSEPDGDGTSDEEMFDSGSTQDEELPEKMSVHPTVLDQAIEELIELFAEEVSFEVGIEVGRDLRFGHLELLGVLDEVPEELRIVDEPGLDVFGQPIASKSKINYECECPKCKRTIVAARFAPHLEKCMGMGRNSSRIASRRIANSASGSSSNVGSNAGNSKDEKSSSQGSSTNGTTVQISDLGLGSDDDNVEEEDDDDDDWVMEKKSSKKGSKKSSDKATKKKGAVNRLRNADVSSKSALSSKSKGGSPSMSLAVSPVESTGGANLEEDFNPHSHHSLYPQ